MIHSTINLPVVILDALSTFVPLQLTTASIEYLSLGYTCNMHTISLHNMGKMSVIYAAREYGVKCIMCVRL